MTHRYHPDPELHDPEDAILWDDCEDCATRATLIGLDDTKLKVAWYASRGRRSLTLNERVLFDHIQRAIDVARRLGFEYEEASDVHQRQ